MVPFVSDVLKRDLKRWVSGDNVCLSTKKTFQIKINKETFHVKL